jgi:proton-coupled amino acid transporter
MFVGGIAIAIPDLEDLLSLIGAVASSMLALIFPSILSIMIFWPIRRETSWLGCLPWPVWVVKDAFIALLGVVGSVFGTYASISNIVAYFQGGDEADKACDITYFPG